MENVMMKQIFLNATMMVEIAVLILMSRVSALYVFAMMIEKNKQVRENFLSEIHIFVFSQCDVASTVCENKAGSYHCNCKDGFEPNHDCRPVLNLGLSDGGIPDEAITASGEEEGKASLLVVINVILVGWCCCIRMRRKLLS